MESTAGNGHCGGGDGVDALAGLAAFGFVGPQQVGLAGWVADFD
ncbi:MAG TPA: hypothetical protein VJT49_05625 [Amycolatopsis sp.]|nr:hypothetical protein [Amycolatopsis sp.]HKS44585.1 hypothetical protein [Amycolatopsis sp.]